MSRGLLTAVVAVFFVVGNAPSVSADPQVIATIPVGNSPWGVGVNPNTNRIYVSNYGSASISVIDGATNGVVATVYEGGQPPAVAVNPDTDRIYVADAARDAVPVIDGITNSVVAVVPAGDGPWSVGVNSATNRVYVANSHSNDVSVIDGATNSVVATVPVGSDPVGVAVNPTTNRIYVTNLLSNSVSVIDGATNAVVAAAEGGSQPYGVAVNPTTNRIYVASVAWGLVVIDGATNSRIGVVTLGYLPHAIGVNPNTNRIYVANEGANSLSVIDGTTNAVIATVAVGDSPLGVGVNPTTNRIYVANWTSQDVFVIEDPHTTERVSLDSAGNEGNARSLNAAITADGRYTAFSSLASNLVSADTNGYEDVFVHDRQTGATERVSVDSTGVEGDGGSGGQTWPTLAISGDGRYVAFCSYATNLVTGDTNGYRDVFVRDRETGVTERVSVDSAGNEGNYPSYSAALSGDGRLVAFSSEASNLVPADTNHTADIFVHDRQTGATQRVSVDSAGNEGYPSHGSEEPAISADGRYVAFRSIATLVDGDNNGATDIFVHDRQTGVTERVSVDSAGNQGNGNSWVPAISADGRYVAFYSDATNLVPGDTNGTYDVFVHDRQTGATTRASVDSDDNQGNGISWFPSISADGRYVSFYSNATNLVPADTNGAYDVFVHDRQTATTGRVSVDSVGNQGNNGSYTCAVSGDGRYVAFYSDARNLVPGDANGSGDVFVHDQDADGDGAFDPVDNCPFVINPAQTDTDTDGEGDACDSDDDNDTIDDVNDNCPLVANADQTDTDSDGQGDTCDSDDDNDTIPDADDTDPLNRFVCRDVDSDTCDDCSVVGEPDVTQDGTDTDTDGACNASDPDDDNDTVADGSDTDRLNAFICQDIDTDTCDDCSVLGQPDVSDDGPDNDSDGACDGGDVCTSDANNDADSDGICVGSGYLPPKFGDDDNCPVVPNEGQANSDTDSHGDACDNCPLVANETQTNTDVDLGAAGASVVGDSLGDVCDADDDNDAWMDIEGPVGGKADEAYLGTAALDNCPNSPPGPGGDAWPLDINMDTFVTVVGDVLPYSGHIGATGGPPSSSNWMQRLDLNMDNYLTVVGDVLKYSGKIGQSCM